MKIKFVIISVLMIVIFSSCAPDHSAYFPDSISINYESIKPFEEYYVSVPKGNKAYVVMGDNDTIAITSIDGAKIEIPNNQSSSNRASISEPRVTYDIYEGEPFYFSDSFYCVAFEDSQNGDYDYNDVILHFKVQKNNGSYKFSCQPIAMGATKILKFGLTLSCSKNGQIYSNDFTFSNDIRLDENFFGSKDQKRSFVNTSDNKNDYYRYPLKNISPCDGQKVSLWITDNALDYNKDKISFIWWIEDETGQKYYSVPTSKNEDNPIDFTDSKGYPYGLIISGVNKNNTFYSEAGLSCGLDWFNYPLEGKPIQQVYTGFNNWLAGKGYINWDEPNEGFYVEAIGEKNINERPTNSFSLYTYDDLTIKNPTSKYTGYLYR